MKRLTLFVVMLFAITATATKSFSQHRYNRSLAITTSSLPGGTVGIAYSTRISATGGTTPYIYSASGLPGGLSINSSTGTISGTPAQSSVGTSSVAITVRDSNTNSPHSATANLQITIAASVAPSPLAITTTSLPGGTAGAAYAGAVAASGGTKPYLFSATGLPGGLSINGSTGTISGTPAQTSVGTSTAAINVTDATSPTAQTKTSNLQITIAASVAPNPLAIMTTSLPGGTSGVAYTGAIAASGGTTP